MTIENLINIIDAKLINTPKVTKISACTIFPSKVELGDLFFADSKESIDKAIENGAYAVVFEGDAPQIKDSEIAYLQVESIKSASMKLLRYVLTKKQSQIYYFSRVQEAMLKKVVSRKSKIYAFTPNSWQKSFELILNSDYDIFITTNLEYANNLSPNYKTLQESESGYIVNDSLLKTTFKIEKYIYQDMNIPPFFVDDLRKVIPFVKELNLEYDINRIDYTKLFRPYYVDEQLRVSSKGESSRVLIFTDSLEVIDSSIEYLKHQGKWTKSIALTPPKTKVELVDRPYWYEDIDSAKEVLKREHFNFAFCYLLSPVDIIEKDEEAKLF
jgi:ferrochelatase